MIAGVAIWGTPRAEAQPACETEAVFATGGMNDPNATAFGGNVHRVTYSASIWPVGPHSYDKSVAEGAVNMVGAVDEYAARCPNSKIIVTGYSQGARVAGDAIDVLDKGAHAGRIRGVLYSDPKNPGGIEQTLQGGIIPGLSMTGAREPTETIPVNQVCNERDGICRLPHILFDPKGHLDNIRGYFDGAHGYWLNPRHD